MAKQQSGLSEAAGVGTAVSDLLKPKRAAPFAKAVKGGVGGAAGAAIGMALEHKEGIKKSAVAITAALMLPVLFLTMLPGLTFGDLSENSGVLNSGTFEKKTISIQHIVTDIYLDGHLVTIEKDKTKTKSSTRTLPLVKPFEAALIALKEQQRQQQKLCGNAYNKDYLEYVLRDKMGNWDMSASILE